MASIVKAPFWRPEVPMPATARPQMSIFDEVATPQMRDPMANRNRKKMNAHYWSVNPR